MENPTLKLIVGKGPRKGETLECKPGSEIRIGRVVRGNTFTIKDPSISQKHLCIQFNAHKWIVSDLDTSNGTFLNDLKLKSVDPFDLSNGDVIKIGESTTLNVFIEAESREVESRDPSQEANRLRRNPRRGAKATKDDEKKKLEKLDSCMESNGAAAGVGNRRRRGATTKGTGVLKDEVSEVQVISERLDVEVKNPKDLVTVDSVQGDLVHTNEIGVEEGKDLKQPERSGICIESNAAAVVRNRGKRAATKGTTGLGDGVSEGQTIPGRLGVEAEDRKDLGTGSSVKEDLLHTNEIGIEEGKDLENMTLGEWFDRMEIYLPKQIHDISEEIIANMRSRAKQFQEYISVQQVEGKGKLPMN